MSEVEKTCENCEYELEDPEGTHCRHCIHSAEEHFKLKEIRDTEQEIRNKAIDEAIKASANAICVGCGYLDGYKCTYKGANCGVSKPMLESVVKALEKLKGGATCLMNRK